MARSIRLELERVLLISADSRGGKLQLICAPIQTVPGCFGLYAIMSNMSQPATDRIVLTAVDDIFFSAKIEAVAKRVGVKLIQAVDAEQLSEKLAATIPELIILDLNSRACSPLDAIRRIKSDPKLRDTPVLGFFSHVQVELEQAAHQAGCDRVVPRSKFSADLPEILSKPHQDARSDP